MLLFACWKVSYIKITTLRWSDLSLPQLCKPVFQHTESSTLACSTVQTLFITFPPWHPIFERLLSSQKNCVLSNRSHLQVLFIKDISKLPARVLTVLPHRAEKIPTLEAKILKSGLICVCFSIWLFEILQLVHEFPLLTSWIAAEPQNPGLEAKNHNESPPVVDRSSLSEAKEF